MTPVLARNRMSLPPPPKIDDVRESHRTAVFRAKVALTAMALVAAVALVAVTSWPLKLLVVLAFARGLFASGVIATRVAPRRGRHSRQTSVRTPSRAWSATPRNRVAVDA